MKPFRESLPRRGAGSSPRRRRRFPPASPATEPTTPFSWAGTASSIGLISRRVKDFFQSLPPAGDAILTLNEVTCFNAFGCEFAAWFRRTQSEALRKIWGRPRTPPNAGDYPFIVLSQPSCQSNGMAAPP